MSNISMPSKFLASFRLNLNFSYLPYFYSVDFLKFNKMLNIKTILMLMNSSNNC